ncbi:hypothetical protein MEO43_23460, partial [Dolichospermum sp. ST_sed5]|nr:hypothetical protein [Dolichospermum sp. ST_sed5]
PTVENYIKYLEKVKKVFIPHRPTLLISLTLNFARWSIRHLCVFISSPPYRVGERLLLFKLN